MTSAGLFFGAFIYILVPRLAIKDLHSLSYNWYMLMKYALAYYLLTMKIGAFIVVL